MLCFLLTFAEDEKDKKEFAAIYNLYHKKLERVAMGILRNDKDTEDAVQNAWLQVIKNFHKTYTIPCDELIFWLISIVKNEALMILRKRKSTLCLEDWDSVVNQDHSNLKYQDLVKLFSRLPQTYRAALEMKFILEYTNVEIARHLGISETAVSTRIARGRELLKKIIVKEGLHL